jgi:hypothetical protein
VRLSLVFYVFLARMAVGTLIALVPLWAMRPAERHLRFQTLLAMVLAAGAAALYLPAIEGIYPRFPHGADAFVGVKGAAPILMVAVALLCLVVNLAFGTFRRTAGRLLLLAAIGVGVGGVFGTAQLVQPDASPGVLVAVTLGGLLGGLLMASVNNAMILGHFYLMIRGLPVAALKRAGRFTAAVVVARVLWFGVVVWLWPGAAERLFGPELIWSSWRVAFGFVGPLVLLWMVKDTVRLKHTQAATGLLYVAIGFALMGELAATYLEVWTGIPV